MISQPVIYLANVLSIACSDGKITHDEDALLKGIALRIGANARAVDQAKQLLVEEPYTIRPLKVTVELMQNIEDMVMVAMVDGELGESEADLIEKFTDKLGITQNEMDAVVASAQVKLESGADVDKYNRRRVAKRAKSITPPPLPPSLPDVPPVPPLPVTSSDEKLVVEQKQSLRTLRKPVEKSQQEKSPNKRSDSVDSFVPPSLGLVITFYGTHSERLDIALNALKLAPESGEHNSVSGTLYYGIWPNADLVDAANVALAAAGLSSPKVYVNGKEIPWDDLFAFTSCAMRRMLSNTLVEFCFGCDDQFLNIWGCRNSEMSWSESAEWFALGEFKDPDGFVFDKNAISVMLEENLKPSSICPFLRRDYMREVLNRFPKHVKAQGGWRFREALGSNSESLLKTIKENVHGCTYSYEALVDSMAPTSEYEAIRLIRGAIKACGMKKVDVGRIRIASGR